MLETEPQIVEQYIATGRVKLVYRHLQQIGPGSELLSEASECAADQGRFWELRAALYGRYRQLFADPLAQALQAGAEVGLDPAALQACLDAGTHEAAVRADYAAAQAEGVRTRPVFRVGEQTIIGAQPFAVFQEILDRAPGG
ncbi:MAG TPA: thioredoxin domain-containing protein [Chloroflexaceae bacterium]|nr:thioredoxin domain-containing protein [Chloroflexaceae bacterium]